MQFDDAPGYGEAEARVAVSGLLIRRLIKAIEYTRQIRFWNTVAGIDDT